MTMTYMGCRLIAVGGDDGFVHLYDARVTSNTPVKSLRGYAGHVTSIALKGDTLVTAGKVERKINPYEVKGPSTFLPDPIVKIFDLRMYRQFNSIPLHSGGGPISVDFFPGKQQTNTKLTVSDVRFLFVGMSTNVLAVSLYGEYQVFDPNGDLNNSYYDAIDTGGFECGTASLSSSAQLMLIGDMGGGIHLLGTHDEAAVNSYESLALPDLPVHGSLAPPPAMYINCDDPVATSKYVLRRKGDYDTPLLSDLDTATSNRV